MQSLETLSLETPGIMVTSPEGGIEPVRHRSSIQQPSRTFAVFEIEQQRFRQSPHLHLGAKMPRDVEFHLGLIDPRSEHQSALICRERDAFDLFVRFRPVQKMRRHSPFLQGKDNLTYMIITRH